MGRISDRNSTFSSGKVSGTLNGPVLALGTRTYSAWPPGIPPYNRYSQTAPPVAKCFRIERRSLAAIGAFAGGILLQATKEAVSAGDDKRDNHPIAFADRGDLGTGFHHFPP